MAILLYEHFKSKSLTLKALWYLLGLGVFISCFLAWHDEHRNSHVLIEEKADISSKLASCSGDLTNAQFKIDIMSLITIYDNKTQRRPIAIVAKLSNFGAPSSALSESWKFRIISENGSVRNGTPSPIGETGYNVCEPGTSGKAIKFMPEDQLYLKAAHIIERNGYEQGVLIFSFDDLHEITPGTIIELSVEDVRHVLYTASEPIERLKSESRSAFIGGFSHPYPVTSTSCPQK